MQGNFVWLDKAIWWSNKLFLELLSNHVNVQSLNKQSMISESFRCKTKRILDIEVKKILISEQQIKTWKSKCKRKRMNKLLIEKPRISANLDFKSCNVLLKMIMKCISLIVSLLNLHYEWRGL